jgi:hypothetical protein
MNKFTKHFLLFALLFTTITGFSQSKYAFDFQGNKIEIPENHTAIDWSKIPQYNGGHYVWMQFFNTPNQTVQNELMSGGVQLLNYISKGTYIAFVPNSFSKPLLSTLGLRGILVPTSNVKMTSSLQNGDIDNWAINGNKILLTALLYENVNVESVLTELVSNRVQIIEKYKGSNVLSISISQSDLITLASLPYIQWIEQVSAPGEKEDTRGRSLHRSSNLDTQTGAGRNYTGDGIGVLVRDDGIVGPHIDFQGRIDNSGANTTGQTHGDGVAGILTGAGNLDPTMRGMAAGSDVYVSNYTSNFLDGVTTTLINSGTVQITNSSYGDGCNGGYTTGTQTVDQQIRTIPTLLHVFSAGNSGTTNCNYGAGGDWGNITGGHKQGKNVIATANVFFDGSLVNSSSRGPAYDGRIKPDIAANGQNQFSTNENNTYMSFGGTSGASPGIAGISAQLYETYADLHTGSLPQSALIKAALLNTANDYGNVGPDYKFGWGIVNGLRAAKLIEDNRYLSSTVANGITNNHSITVPAGTNQVRFMVYWSDPAATPGVTTCLVNDLDLTVVNTSSTTLFPWILDPTPTSTALNTPATTGADHLNNMEQVLINNPTAGTYTINISGFNVPMGPQEYFIVYEIIQQKVTVTYPNMGESFVPGEIESIHWDAVNTAGSFVLEFSTNNGTSWNNIATVSANTKNYGWTIPNTVTGSAKIRVTNGANVDVSDDVFSIAPLVLNQQITQVCPDSAKFTWTAVVNAESYDLYILGTKYMEVAGTSGTVNVTIPVTSPFNPIWYAVVAKNNSLSWKGRRSIASYYPGGLLNCSLSNDVEMTSINNSGGDFSSACNGGIPAQVSVTITNSGINSQSNFPVSYQINSNTPVIETYMGTIASGAQANYTFTAAATGFTNGPTTLTCTVSLSGDQIASNDTQVLSFFNQTTASSTPFIETFDPSGIPSLWTILNPDGMTTWELTNVVGSAGTSTNAYAVDHFAYNNATAAEDIIETELFDLGGSNAFLTFDLAKAQYSATYTDELRVDISSDCGATYQTIYQKAGSTLETIANQTGNWSPGAATHWRNETIDLSSFLPTSAIFRFVAINGYGNGTFIDNINITSNAGIRESQNKAFSIFPNPTNGIATILFSNEAVVTLVKLTNQLGQILNTLHSDDINGKEITFDLNEYERGVYFVTIHSEGKIATRRIIKN